MDQEMMMKQIVEEVMKAMGGTPAAAGVGSACQSSGVTSANYPLGEKMADKVFSPTGKKLSDMALEQILDGRLTAEDMRIAPETLEMQAQVAESVGRDAFAGNLRRASELIAVPDDRLLEIYNALRPYRSTRQELEDIANEMEHQYGCKVNAAFIRDAAAIYEKRGRLKRD
ncbi:diol dehydratase small subunit [Aminipila butyrica]|uniref:Diol dehydratase small subunit n=1 Tax=Aminipila butyrica TaxID=433296 RepID=A0A858BUV4_9FIRM|nr:diol dehydratase small subunit [Aminipila butyrica]QIB69162.1 diol dehydratase small subunit [Aminipila butyrica]